jgi:hypothetical protein
MKPKSAQAHQEGTVEKIRALGSMDCHPEIKKRRSEFAKLVTKPSKDHQIGDRKVLGRAVDIAIRMYHDNDVLSKRDNALLLKHIPKVTSVLLYLGNDKRIADLLVRREDARIRGGKPGRLTVNLRWFRARSNNHSNGDHQ